MLVNFTQYYGLDLIILCILIIKKSNYLNNKKIKNRLHTHFIDALHSHFFSSSIFVSMEPNRFCKPKASCFSFFLEFESQVFCED